MEPEISLILLIVGGVVAFFVLIYLLPVNLWFTAQLSNVRISLLNLVLMRLRKVPSSLVTNEMITFTTAGLHISTNEIETHYLAVSNVNKVIKALISADKANIPLDFKLATAMDLAGRDVFDAVQLSVNPQVINTPTDAPVGKDGIQLIANARGTVRANINQRVGGGGDETILVRAAEGTDATI